MFSKVIEIGETPHITIEECYGDLTVQGTSGGQITLNLVDGAESIVMTQEAETLRLSAQENCRIVCPVGTTLDIQVIRGGLKVSGVHGSVMVGEVNGDAFLRDIGPLDVEKVFGALHVQQVAGDMRVNEVRADARIYQVEGALHIHAVAADAKIGDITGPVTLDEVGSDLKAEGLAQGLTLGGAGSDVKLEPPFTPGATYQVRAGSDLTVKLPADANVRLSFKAGGGVRSSIPDLALHEEGGTVFGTLGAGEAFLEAQVGGRVRLKTTDAPDESAPRIELDLSFLDSLADIGPMIEARVSEAMAAVDISLQEGLRYIDGDRIRVHIERAAEKAEQAAERIAERARAAAEREAEHARRHAEREAERARLRAEHAERRWQRASGYHGPTPPAPPTPPTPPASPTPREDDKREERLQVLRMVEQGKLSPEEAANLLAALR
ncbi:MAG TPA: hypothetical protein PKH77_10010 [Anaerolineae bacterium]|nr:hypothetical protein [Anaerolineae bacterium]